MDHLIQAEQTPQPVQSKVDLLDPREFHDQLSRNATEQWNMFTSNSFYFDEKLRSPGTGIRGAIKTHRCIRQEFGLFKRRNSGNMKIYENMKVQRVNYGYRRFHPLYGVEHIIQLTTKTEKKVRLENSGKTQQISTSQNRWFHTQLPFGNLLHNVDPLI